MTDPIDRLALAETPDDVASVLAVAPHLSGDAARWHAARRAVRADLARDLPDADLLALRALDPADLTPAEASRLDAARPALDAALARHPGLSAMADAADADARDFARMFDAATDGSAARETDAPLRVSTAEPRPAALRAPRAADRDAAPRRRGRSPWVWRSAALLGVAAFAVVLSTVFLRDLGFDTITAQQAQTVTLADGSTAELAQGAVLMVPTGSRDARQARLRAGDALFRIRHDADHPFSVETPNADVLVLGTVFAVSVDDAATPRVATRVTLLEGRVDLALRGTDAPVRLQPGQSSTVAALTPPTAPAPADRGAALAFLPDLDLRDVLARDAARQIAERFGVSVSVSDALAAEPVSASFRMSDGPDAAVRALAMALGAHATGGDAAFQIAE